MFELLSACGLQTAFVGRDNANSFVARRCKMLPYEVVVRREAHGSYLKRRPELRKGHHFPKLLVEFYLKTSGRKWKKHDLVCDDPLMRYIEGACIFLYNPAEPIADQEPFLELSESEVFGYEEEWKLFKLKKSAAIDTFLVLERAWQIEGSALVDFKVEFGLDETTGQLLLADVIDNDSWRVLHKGSYIDKQVYRDGGKLDEVAAKYAYVAATTARFGLPLQRIILWTGSESDKMSAFYEAAGYLSLTRHKYALF